MLNLAVAALSRVKENNHVLNLSAVLCQDEQSRTHRRSYSQLYCRKTGSDVLTCDSSRSADVVSDV